MAQRRALGYAVLLLFSIADYGSHSPQDSVPFTLIKGSMVTVSVLINGRGPYEFVLDTGAESSEIEVGLAADLKMRAADRVTLFTPGGKTTRARVFAEEIAIGDIRVANPELLVGSLEGLRQVHRKVMGILGQNFLSHFNYLLDYERSRIEFDPVRENRSSDIRVPLVRDSGRLVLTARGSERTDVRLVVDSGCSTVILFHPDVPGFRPCDLCTAEMRTSMGTVGVNTGTLRRLNIGLTSFDDLPAAIVRNPDSEDRQVDGLLPTSLFHSVYFNNRESYVVLRPRSALR